MNKLSQKQSKKLRATIKVLDKIVEDSRNDIVNVADKPFTGEVIIELIACQGAMIATLASIIKDHIKGGN